MASFRHTSGPKCFGTSPKKSFFDGGDKDIPGPGCNSPLRLDKIENPEWSFGLSEDRNSFTEPFRIQYPSPQCYKPHLSSIQNDPIQYTIPQAGIDKKPVELYHHIYYPDIKKINQQDPIYSFGYSIQNNYDNGIPGVGSYQLEVKNDAFNKIQHNFGTGNRPQPYGQQGKFPGPGKYLQMNLQSTTMYSFPKSVKVPPQNKDPLGKFYDINLKRKAPKANRFIYEGKEKKRQTTLFHHNENPAPNQYHTLVLHKIQGGDIEHSKRKSLQQSELLKYPSPDKYSGEEVLTKTRKGYSFGKTIRSLSITDNLVPPPGTYEASNTLNTIGGAIGKQKEKPQEKNPTPGSFEYRPKVTLTKLKAQSTIIFKGNRKDFSKTITGPIGPGSYNNEIQKNKSQLGKIGRSQRHSMYSPNSNPGVGDYDISGNFGKLPKYYTSPKKLNENGYSTFHEKLRMKIQQRQRQIHKEQTENKSEENEQILEERSKEAELIS